MCKTRRSQEYNIKTLGPPYKETYLAAVRAVILTDQQSGNPPGTGSNLFRKRTHHKDSSSSFVPVVGSIKATWICTVENLSIKSSKKSSSIHPVHYPLRSYRPTFPLSLSFIVPLALRPYGPYINTFYLSFTVHSFVIRLASSTFLLRYPSSTIDQSSSSIDRNLRTLRSNDPRSSRYQFLCRSLVSILLGTLKGSTLSFILLL